MGKRIIREVSYSLWDEDKQNDRVFSGALAVDAKGDSEQVLEVSADGFSLDIKIEDIPLLIRVLQEFMD